MKKINWKYGVGEVIIVIIGLYGAFSLNTFRENVKNTKLKVEYLESLALDIKTEIKTLKKNDGEIYTILKTIHDIKPFLGKKKGNRDTIVNKVFELSTMVDFYPENNTYKTLINSGDMKLIDNFKLRRTIEEHYSQHKLTLKSYKKLATIYEKYFTDLFVRKIDFDEIKKGNYDFLNDKLLKNLIVTIEGSYYLIMNENRKCNKSNLNLLERINTEIAICNSDI
ncbi:hypothetical protein [Polaribacter porphyrae]|uniref:Uncharacterized protein n=1 Tax=Polaribacter porphyrae TaxID=1137780 RepID=A0A2S7WL96_9FLAO|nr:hypothetical protein [Polaribacter porphyrae]PQJ78369.1 hypothetical protein BTO18_03810 [Polaribacter porphyrae]